MYTCTYQGALHVHIHAHTYTLTHTRTHARTHARARHRYTYICILYMYMPSYTAQKSYCYIQFITFIKVEWRSHHNIF